jgi:hypothetical protein
MTSSNSIMSKNRLYALLLIVLFTGSACSLLSPNRTSARSNTATPVIPTSTSQPTLPAIVLPTDPPQPTDTQVPLLPTATQSVPPLGGTPKVLLDDDFSSQDTSLQNGWLFGVSDSFDQVWTQGSQVFNLKSANNIYWDYLTQSYQDVALTIEVQAATPGYVEYGIIFAIVSGNTKSQYLYSVDNLGEYYLQKMTDDQWAPVSPTNQTPIPTTQSSFINTGQARNQLGVIYLDGTIYLYANGHFLNSYTDPNPIKEAGNAGLNFQTDKDVPVTVNLYRYTVYEAQSALDAWGTKQ